MMQLRKGHKDRIALSREDFKFRSHDLSKHSESQIKLMRDEIEKISKNELEAWEEGKETQTRNKIKSHEAVRVLL